jgi:elongation factor P
VYKASELKRGQIVDMDGIPHIVRQFESKSPSSRGAVTVYKVRFINLKTHHKVDMVYKGEDLLKEADCLRVAVQFSYIDDNTYYFMNMEDFSQYGIDVDQIEEQLPYLVDQQEDIIALVMDGNLLAIELPQAVVMPIVETPPAVSGSSATNRTKTAKLPTGLEVQVPEYLSPGELIRINTVTGKFMSRA